MSVLCGGGMEQNGKDGGLEASRERPQPVEDIYGGGQTPPLDGHPPP